MGCIGIRASDFMQLTPDQFNAIYEQWNRRETSLRQTSWEQTRFLAHCSVMPYARKGFSPTDLVRFDWDTATTRPTDTATREDFDRIVERFG